MTEFPSMRILRSLPAAALACLALALFAGCAKGGKTATFGSSEDLLGYGEYAAQSMDAGGQLTRIKLNQGNTYVKRKFKGACLLSESKGEWEATQEMITFKLQEIRHRPGCETEDWQVEKSDKVTERNLQKVTPKSFELLDQEEQSAAEWVKYVKP